MHYHHKVYGYIYIGIPSSSNTLSEPFLPHKPGTGNNIADIDIDIRELVDRAMRMGAHGAWRYGGTWTSSIEEQAIKRFSRKATTAAAATGTIRSESHAKILSQTAITCRGIIKRGGAREGMVNRGPMLACVRMR